MNTIRDIFWFAVCVSILYFGWNSGYAPLFNLSRISWIGSFAILLLSNLIFLKIKAIFHPEIMNFLDKKRP